MIPNIPGMASFGGYNEGKGNTVYKVNKQHIKPIQLFCIEQCRKTCLMAKIENQQVLKIRNSNKDYNKMTNCYLKYQLEKVMDKETLPYISDIECLIEMTMKVGPNKIQVAAILDTGAQVSCMGLDIAEKLLNKDVTRLKQTTRKLVGANNKYLQCQGIINIACTIGSKTHKVQFFVLENCGNVLLGLPDIRKFNIMIKTGGYTVEKIENIRAVIEDKELNEVTVPKDTFLATPAYKHVVDKTKTITLTLILYGDHRKFNGILYNNAEIYDCLCLTKDSNLCEHCKETGPIFETVIIEHYRMVIKYSPPYIHDLRPGVDFFQTKLKPTHSIKTIEAEPPSFSFNEVDGLEYDQGGFIVDDNINQKAVYPVMGQTTMYMTQLNNAVKDLACTSCKLGNEVFCNYQNENCHSLLQYKRNLKIESPEKCTIIQMTTFKKANINEAVIIHNNSWNQNIEKLLKTNHFVYQESEKTKNETEIKLVHLTNDRTHCFILVGKISLLNIETLLTKISTIVQPNNIVSIHMVDFKQLKISEQLVKQIFWNNKIKILTYQSTDEAEIEINRLTQQGREVKASLEEEVDFESQLNVVLKCKETKTKMLQLCKELNQYKDDLKPLWSKSTHDVGLFKERTPPGRTIKFRFPINPEMANKPPMIIKTNFITNRLQEQGKQMLEALEKAKIIDRGYSKYNARTHFLLKPPKELTVSEWVKLGYGKAESFIAGTLNDKGPLTVRMVHHFQDLNERTINTPIYQPSTSEQLRKISPGIKFLSVIDITACFFSLMLDKESSEMTGFDTGIERYQRFRYLRVPMGTRISKCLQDAALLHAISELGNYIIYSDNIIIISPTKTEHFTHVKNILVRLREHGLKCKLSKANFFITNKVRLYGHILDLQEGTISPDKDKLEALRSKPVPGSRKELKSFLGSLQFFASLLPIAGETLATLHQATRGKTFNWTNEQQLAYEAIIKLISQDGLIFVHRGDEDRPFRVAIDTSEFHTSYVVFQMDNQLNHRPIQYGIKTWASPFANHIPEYRELLGILHTLNALEAEYEHKKFPLIVYTDNLPLCLMNIAARFSRKIARIKLFIESLNWVIIHWSPGSSELIALPDYYSRQKEDKPKAVRRPGPLDSKTCAEISKKIDTSKLYSGPRSSFLIDSLIELPTEKLNKIKDKTATLDDKNKLVFIEDHTTPQDKPITAQTNQSEHNQPEESKTQKIERVKLKITRDNEGEHMVDLDKHQLQQRQKQSDKKDNNKIKIQYPETQDIIKDTNEEKTTKKEQGHRDKPPITQNEQEHLNILDYPNLINTRDSNIIPREKRHEIKGKGTLVRWYNNFLNRAKYLDLEKFKQALEMDPHWKHILEICKKQLKYLQNEKTYFICGEILVCKEKVNDATYVYKVCLPGALAYDTILMAHRQLLHIHGKKLINNLQVYFEIKDIEKLVTHITNECFICGLNQVQPAGGSRPPMIKRTMLVNRKCSTWFVDELTLVDNNTGRELAGFSKLLVAIDGFTHFIVIEPVKETVTSEIFLKFIQERILQIFGPCEALVTDNDSKLTSNLVQMVCGVLGIRKLESLPYSPRANLSELANKLLISGLRHETLSLYVNPKYFHILLSNIVYMINSLVFTNSKNISPYLLMFALYPKQNILQIYEQGAEEIVEKEEYLKHLLLINNAYTKMRIAMIDKRKYEETEGKNKNYWDALNPGDIVMIRNPEQFIKKKNFKLRPLYKSKFVIVRRTKSSAFLRPLDNIYLKQFQESTSEDKPTPDWAYKCDIFLLKKVSHLTLLHSNKTKDYYAHFMENNTTPPPYYMLLNENTKSGLLRTWEEMDENNQEMLNELKTAEAVAPAKKSVKLIKTQLKKETYRETMIKDIAAKFKEIQVNRISTKQEKQKVSFNLEVSMRALVSPDVIYFCKRPKTLKLEENQIPALRTIKTGGNTYFCSCSACSKQLDKCILKPCEQCFGKSLKTID